ncbi:response regulator [Spirosoma aerophilum]
MPKPIHCILLIDDDPDDNFLHKMVIEDSGQCDFTRIAEGGRQALKYLTDIDHPDYIRPDILILDINMPGMNGFEFLAEYEKLEPYLKSRLVVLMLTTSLNPGDTAQAQRWVDVKAYRTKPLTKAMIQEMVNSYFL